MRGVFKTPFVTIKLSLILIYIIMKPKSWKTNLVGYVGVLMLVLSTIAVVLGKASIQEVGTFLVPLGVLLTTLNGFLSKDSDASHSKSLITDPDKDEYPKDKS